MNKPKGSKDLHTRKRLVKLEDTNWMCYVKTKQTRSLDPHNKEQKKRIIKLKNGKKSEGNIFWVIQAPQTVKLFLKY